MYSGPIQNTSYGHPYVDLLILYSAAGWNIFSLYRLFLFLLSGIFSDNSIHYDNIVSPPLLNKPCGFCKGSIMLKHQNTNPSLSFKVEKRRNSSHITSWWTIFLASFARKVVYFVWATSLISLRVRVCIVYHMTIYKHTLIDYKVYITNQA